VGDWYTIGIALGLGAALAVLLAGLLSTTPLGRAAAVVLAGAAGAAAGLVGAAAAVVVVTGALRRGATRGGLALILAAAAVGIAALAFVPVLGYLEAVALPAIAARLRRTQGERYAGLRSLAKD
jgi:hypothetical protein